MDLTKFYENGLVLDKELHFGSAGKDIADLISEMNTNGLLVSSIDTSGEVIRVKVTGGANHRNDKSNEKSGWYCFFETGNYQACTYGNWRSQETYKWTNTNVNKLSPIDQKKLKAEINEAKQRANEYKTERQNQVAEDCANRLKNSSKCVNHAYLSKKGVKNYGLRIIKDSLVIPIYNFNRRVNDASQELRSLQYITAKSKKNNDEFIKRFVSASEVNGSIYNLNFEWSDFSELDTLIICEGYATGASIAESLNDEVAVAVCFSSYFGMKAVQNIRKYFLGKIILAFDHDASGVGLKKGDEISAKMPNCLVRIPSEEGDFNDLHQKYGTEKVRSEILETKFNLRKYSIKNLVGKPEEVKFLVDRFIPLGSPAVIASIGGVGKSYSVIQLAVAIATGGKWWGKDIKETGSSLIFAAEDSLQEIHRRVDMLDPFGRRFDYDNDIYIFPVPEQKEPLILLREEGLTNQAHELMEELATIPKLKMVCFDPLQAFTTASISQSNEAGQLWGSFTSQISSNLGVSTITTHHLNKSALSNSSNDALSHRQEILGASSIVNSTRLVISMWLADEQTCTDISLDQGLEFNRMNVVRAGIVKSNSGNVDYSIKTLFRKNAVLEILEENKGGINWD